MTERDLAGEAGMISRWRGDAELAELAIHSRVRFGLTSNGLWNYYFSFHDESLDVENFPAEREADFTIFLDETHWLDLTSAHPYPGRQSILAYLGPNGFARLGGSPESFAQHLQLVRRIIEVARPPRVQMPTKIPSANNIRGGYVRVDIPGVGVCDVFHERSGEGPPMVLLATAGSDTRQFHGIMSNPSVTSRFELIAVDLPWHGKSNPAMGKRNTSYSLDSEKYIQTVTSVIDELHLNRPIVFGSSMAGALVIQLAARSPQHISGAISAQVGPRLTNRRTPWITNPRINQSLHVAEWTYGLMSPESPKVYRDRVWWGYSQGGFGIYDADLAYYCDDWDIGGVKELLDATVPIVLLSGSYDYSVPPSATRELAAEIPGAVFREMPELGHFPHAENPPVFCHYLLWAADQIPSSASLPKESIN